MTGPYHIEVSPLILLSSEEKSCTFLIFVASLFLRNEINLLYTFQQSRMIFSNDVSIVTIDSKKGDAEAAAQSVNNTAFDWSQ